MKIYDYDTFLKQKEKITKIKVKNWTNVSNKDYYNRRYEFWGKEINVTYFPHGNPLKYTDKLSRREVKIFDSLFTVKIRSFKTIYKTKYKLKILHKKITLMV